MTAARLGDTSQEPGHARAAGARQGRLDPAVAQVRLAVRRSLTTAPQVTAGALVLVACSGGADSLALASATAFEAGRQGLRAGGVTVDHGLQPGSAEQAARVSATLTEMGLDPVRCVRVKVADRSAPASYRGPEAAAREARYAALDAVATQCDAAAVLLGHTMEDQAETVLLGLARGSGARSIAGMAPVTGRYLRPLLGVRREMTRAACTALGLRPWDDPQNYDETYARVRVRERILPLLEELLGPGVTQALARTADQLRADADVLDELAREAADRLMPDWRSPSADGLSLDADEVAALPAAVRTRLLKNAAIVVGVPAGSLTATHVADLDELIVGWHGQRWADLPGGVRCQRRYGRLRFSS